MRTTGLRDDLRRAWSGQEPDRHRDWVTGFDARFAADLVAGCSILDVGAGRTPYLEAARRPPGTTYVGLDVSRHELESAPPGAYDQTFVADITKHVAELDGRFDIAISYQLLEHVKPLEDAIENIRQYLRPGGRFVALLSGGFSYFALAGRVVPVGVTRRVLQRSGRDPETVFEAHYDHCYGSALERLMTRWSTVTIEPRWGGASYLTRYRPLLLANTLYERLMMAGGFDNLATHYLIDATR